MAAKLKVTLVRSKIGRPEKQRRILQSLGLRKLNATKIVTATPQIRGMIVKVLHLLKVEEAV
jgi:large subunit ribosomal protein L30